MPDLRDVMNYARSESQSVSGDILPTFVGPDDARAEVDLAETAIEDLRKDYNRATQELRDKKQPINFPGDSYVAWLQAWYKYLDNIKDRSAIGLFFSSAQVYDTAHNYRQQNEAWRQRMLSAGIFVNKESPFKPPEGSNSELITIAKMGMVLFGGYLIVRLVRG